MSTRTRSGNLAIAAGMALMALALLPPAAHATTAEEDMAWTGGLRQAWFDDREILSDDLIVLEAPQRAENAAVVPVSIKAGIAQTEERYVRTLWLIVDKNPAPLVGKFRFTPNSGRVDLGLNLRIDAYTPVRAIAETNDGVLHMSRRFVKASGGCSAPAASGAGRGDLGQMTLQLAGEASEVGTASPTMAQLMIRHPNRSGLQMDQVTRLYAPAEFVRQVKVSFEGKEIFTAETGFAVSENPSFRFYFAPQGVGELTAEIMDTEGRQFTETYAVSAATGEIAVRE